MPNRPTDFKNLLESIEAGSFHDKLEKLLSDVGNGVIDNGKAGEVTLKLKMAQISKSSQVAITGVLSYKRPRPRGAVSEDYTSEEIPFYVNEGGKITLFAEKQGDLGFELDGGRDGGAEGPTTDHSDHE